MVYNMKKLCNSYNKKFHGEPTYSNIYSHFMIHKFCNSRGGFPSGAKKQIGFLYAIIGFQVLVTGLKPSCAYDALEQFANTGNRLVSVCGVDTFVPMVIKQEDAKVVASCDKDSLVTMFSSKLRRSGLHMSELYLARLAAIKKYNKMYNEILANSENLPTV